MWKSQAFVDEVAHVLRRAAAAAHDAQVCWHYMWFTVCPLTSVCAMRRHGGLSSH